MNDVMIRQIAITTIREVARQMFEKDGVSLELRTQSWVDTDSYDAGIVDAAKYLLRVADDMESRVRGQQ